jgi:hypothetical protein
MRTTGLDTGQERHVSRIDTDLTFQRRSDQKLGFTRVDELFGADPLHMHLGHKPSP